MTTPERLRRRQRIEGAFLILIGVAIIASSLYFRGQDAEQRQCLSRYAAEQSAALTARAELSAKSAKVDQLEAKATRQLFVDAFASKTRDEVRAAFADYQATIATVDKRRAEISEEREKNPLPDFPPGTCE